MKFYKIIINTKFPKARGRISHTMIVIVCVENFDHNKKLNYIIFLNYFYRVVYFYRKNYL
jgi:hypothetical protein